MVPPAAADAPDISTLVVEGAVMPAFQANRACGTTELILTYDKHLRVIESSGGRLVEIDRITGTVTGPEGSATFRAVRIFTIRRDGTEHDAGLTYQYLIPGTATVIVTNGRDDRGDAQRLQPLCEALLG